MQQLLQKEGSAHVFNDEATMSMVTQAIIEKGSLRGSFVDMNAMDYTLTNQLDIVSVSMAVKSHFITPR